MSRMRFYSLAALIALGWIGLSAPASAQKMRVVELPVIEGADDVSYMKGRGDVRYQVASDFKTAGTFYAKKLTELRWTKSKKDNLQRNFWVQTFSKDGMSLVVRVSKEKKGSAVRLTPKGLMWEEDDQPTPKDLPYPEDAAEIEYNDFLGWIDYKSPSDVKTVAKYLSTELVKKKWTQHPNESEYDHFVRMKFTFDKSTVDIDVREEDGGSDISIRTDGMQWDGMKAEIKQAKQEAKRLAELEEKKQEAAEMAAAIAKRKEKHKPAEKSGTDQLPTLPNEGKVVMDGKTITLPIIIAYEVFEYDDWATKIVATQKTLKLDTLLARLKKNGHDMDEDGQSPSWPEPYLLIKLDEDDKPWNLNLRADGTPGHGSHDELTGSAVVQNGRARGTVALSEPGDFFDKVYTAEISFDVPVLTGDSTPQKRLAGAGKLANSGKLTIGNKTYNLPNVVAYEMMFFDDPMTTVVFSESPLNMAKLNAALGRKAADEYFEFTPQVKLIIDADDNVSSVSIWADNMSFGGNSKLDDNVVIEDGRARGTARMREPDEVMNREYNFEVSFDLNVLGKKAPAQTRPAGSLIADAYNGLPIPEGHEGMMSEGSPFLKETKTTVAADLKAVVDFYRFEMTSGEWGQWNEDTTKAKFGQGTANLSFSGPSGNLEVGLDSKGKQTVITLLSRDATAAKAAGFLPGPGKARLFIANGSARAAVITISGRDYTIKAGAGARDPKTGINWEVAPGNYTVEIKTPRGQIQSEKLKLVPGKTLGVMIDSSGRFNTTELY